MQILVTVFDTVLLVTCAFKRAYETNFVCLSTGSHTRLGTWVTPKYDIMVFGSMQ